MSKTPKQKMTEAVLTSLKFWTYLHNHNEIRNKEDTPKYIYKLVKSKLNNCPLCDLILKDLNSKNCYYKNFQCPLHPCVNDNNNGCFDKWVSENQGIRYEGSGEIVDKLKEWLRKNL